MQSPLASLFFDLTVFRLVGAISPVDFKSRLSGLDKDTELVFYCG